MIRLVRAFAPAFLFAGLDLVLHLAHVKVPAASQLVLHVGAVLSGFITGQSARRLLSGEP